MATIANQIKRISDATDLLRTKGSTGSESISGLGLKVPVGSYWNKDSGKYELQDKVVDLGSNDQIDKIAAAFASMNTIVGEEIKVLIPVVTNGNTTVANSLKLADGFYSNATIVPYIQVNDDEDIVINVENPNHTLTSKSGTIKPNPGFNYIGELGYTVQPGSINGRSVSYTNDSVIAQIETAGWLDAGTQKISVDLSTLKSKKVGEAEILLNPVAEIIPDPTNDIIVTISQGIYGSDRTITVKSVQSQMGGDATAADILSGKIVWIDGKEVTGSMPNYGGIAGNPLKIAAASILNVDNSLAIQPATGYYNDYSAIITNIAYNPTRTFGTDQPDTPSTFGDNTMLLKVYYETIPAGYYANTLGYKITVLDAKGSMSIDYSNRKAQLNISTAGWIGSGTITEVTIKADSATYEQTLDDLGQTDHQFTITPIDESYLTQVTIDNSLIFNLLSAI